MRCEVIYQKMLEKVNRNYTNGGMTLDRARAVYLFNEEQNKFVEWVLKKRNSSDVLDVSLLLTSSPPLVLQVAQSNFSRFDLPKDFFSFSNISIRASSGGCVDYLHPVEVKSENINEWLFDENNKPSFKFRETLYHYENDTVKIYKDNFDISEVSLNYYRYPSQFDIEGYITDQNISSRNVEPEFDDKVIDRIISMCATSFDINNENFNKVQLDVNRVVSKY